MNATQLFQKLTGATKMISIRTPRTEDEPALRLDWPANEPLSENDLVGFFFEDGEYHGAEVIAYVNEQAKVRYEDGGRVLESLWMPRSSFTLIMKW